MINHYLIGICNKYNIPSIFTYLGIQEVTKGNPLLLYNCLLCKSTIASESIKKVNLRKNNLFRIVNQTISNFSIK